MTAAEQLYSRLNSVSGLGGEVLLDDRIQLTIGRRLTQAKFLGLPHVVALGKKVHHYLIRIVMKNNRNKHAFVLLWNHTSNVQET